MRHGGPRNRSGHGNCERYRPAHGTRLGPQGTARRGDDAGHRPVSRSASRGLTSGRGPDGASAGRGGRGCCCGQHTSEPGLVVLDVTGGRRHPASGDGRPPAAVGELSGICPVRLTLGKPGVRVRMYADVRRHPDTFDLQVRPRPGFALGVPVFMVRGDSLRQSVAEGADRAVLSTP
ncbi:DUF6207 family protein [Streptomyces sp. MH60]|uniref:DUF6207 family protein n=1 Tax=Streptomyces sp. MH60 TaxID=1940758 RepID=UPI00406D3788